MAVRLGMQPDQQWDKVIQNISTPTIRNGIYPAMEVPVENSPSTMTTFMYGVLPGRGIDKDAMRNTLHKVSHVDQPQNSVTWGTATMAMTATRLNEPERALQLLVGKYDEWKAGYSAE